MKKVGICTIIIPLILFIFLMMICPLKLWANEEFSVDQNIHLSLLNRINLRAEIVTSPKFYNNSIYIQTKDEIIAINASNWSVNWKTKCPGKITNTGFIIYDQKLFAPDMEGNIYQINLKNGVVEKIYRMPLFQNGISGIVNGLLLSNGQLFVSYDSLILISWNIENGNENWRFYPTEKTSILISETSKGIVSGMFDGIQVFSPIDGKVLFDYKTNSPVTWLASMNKNIINFATTKDGLSSFYIFDTKTHKITKQAILLQDNIRCISEVNGEYLISGEKLMRLDSNLDETFVNNKIRNLGCVNHYMGYSFGMVNSSKLVFFNQNSGELLSSHNYFSNILQNSLLKLDPLLVNDRLVIPVGKNLWIYEFIY